MTTPTISADDEKLLTEISQLGLRTAGLMTKELGKEHSMRIRLFGKVWRVTVEEQTDTPHSLHTEGRSRGKLRKKGEQSAAGVKH